MYHISDLKKFFKCPRFYYLDMETENVFKPYLRSDESYTALLKEKLHIDNAFEGSVGDDPLKAIEAINDYNWFINARFAIGELRFKIPFLHKLDNTYDVYFMYYGTQIRDLDLFSYRISIQALEKIGLVINEVYISYVNPEYVYQDHLDPEELLIITNKDGDNKILDLIDKEVIDYQSIIYKLNNNDLSSYQPTKTRACHSKNICPYYHDCFKDEEKLPDDSILTLVSSQYKNKMYQDGFKLLKDVDETKLEGNRVQFAQIMASKNGGLFVDKLNLNNWLKEIAIYPISFIDFEWDRYLIPPYEKMKPLDVIPFEFALYIDDGSGKLKHHTFISNGDCRREFVETLINTLPKTGKIFAYNADGAEILRLKELAACYPEYAKELNEIINRFVDLATPFIEGLVYDVKMAGNFTLKKLVSIVSNMSYSDLDIDDGMSAVYNWRDIDKGKDIEKEKVLDDLKKYCSLDAYGLYLVYNWLNNLVQ